MSKQPKYYVVWHGVEPGIYRSWKDCERQVKGFDGAVFKAFPTEAEAEEAYRSAPYEYVRRRPQHELPAGRKSRYAGSTDLPPAPPAYRTDTVLPLPPEVTADALAVDAACSGNPGKMEYRGVYLKTGQVVFHYGPVYGTNNIGEFLAIVHALALLRQKGTPMTIYSDSRNAMLWVKARKCRTKLPRNARTEQLFQMIERAERWLADNEYRDIPILKWDTRRWGEVPADFGRK